ncbi:MAG: molybdenum cofactor guanylyltransferase, partial [Bacteroidales bacterium]|nr:molybdenum cofactor guanylyltransferase [Bacteroidales bacterium]
DYKKFGLKIIKDVYTGIGPISGIYSCLQASTTEKNIVVTCDMPLINKKILAQLISNLNDYHLVVPIVKDYPEMLCAGYKKSLEEILKGAIDEGKYKMQHILKHVKFKKVHFNNSYYFSNINTPQDLIQIR